MSDSNISNIVKSSIALFVVVLIPLLLVRMPPLLDLPNHLARFHILRTIESDPILQQYYVTNWASIPNLICDFLLVFPGRFLPLFLGSKFIILLYFILSVAGVFWLHKECFGYLSFFPLIVFLVLYNHILLQGFINYLMGSALLVLGLALWIHLKKSKPLKRIIYSSLMALVIYYSHLFPFVLYLICVAVFELQAFWENKPVHWSRLWPSFLVAFPQVIVPAVLFLFFSPTVEAAGHIAFGDFVRKITSGLMLPFKNYVPALDAATLLAGISFYIVGLAFGFLQLSRSMWGVLCTLLLVHFLTPQYLMLSPGGDIRTMIPFVLVMISSTRFTKKSSRFRIIFLVLMSSLFLIRTAVVAKNWRWADQTIYNEYQQIFQQIPRGGKVASLFINTGPGWFANPPHAHYVTLAIIEKSAFVPRLFTSESQQPVALRSIYKDLPTLYWDFWDPAPAKPLIPDPTNQHNPFYKSAFHGMDYLLVANFKGVKGTIPSFLHPVLQTDSLALYKITYDSNDLLK